VHDPDLTRLIPKTLAVQAGHEPELVINGDGSAVRDFVHVKDMADTVVRGLHACVGGGHRVRVLDVLEVAEQVTGSPIPIRHRPSADEPPILLADNTRIRQDLGWAPRNSELRTILADAWNALTGENSPQE
jgi:UDP-glucose 4-epimerase